MLKSSEKKSMLENFRANVLKLHEPDMGKQKPVEEIIEPLLGITKAADGTNKPYKIWEILL